MKAFYKTTFPYQKDAMSLPVKNLDAALPFYQSVMGFHFVSRQDVPTRSVILKRDNIQIGLAENGGGPSQDGCFFEVDDVEAAFAEMRSNGLEQEDAGYRVDQYGSTHYRVFFVKAPDGLCYCLGQRQA